MDIKHRKVLQKITLNFPVYFLLKYIYSINNYWQVVLRFYPYNYFSSMNSLSHFLEVALQCFQIWPFDVLWEEVFVQNHMTLKSFVPVLVLSLHGTSSSQKFSCTQHVMVYSKSLVKLYSLINEAFQQQIQRINGMLLIFNVCEPANEELHMKFLYSALECQGETTLVLFDLRGCYTVFPNDNIALICKSR